MFSPGSPLNQRLRGTHPSPGLRLGIIPGSGTRNMEHESRLICLRSSTSRRHLYALASCQRQLLYRRMAVDVFQEINRAVIVDHLLKCVAIDFVYRSGGRPLRGIGRVLLDELERPRARPTAPRPSRPRRDRRGAARRPRTRREGTARRRTTWGAGSASLGSLSVRVPRGRSAVRRRDLQAMCLFARDGDLRRDCVERFGGGVRRGVARCHEASQVTDRVR